jgi:hypothetical protein
MRPEALEDRWVKLQAQNSKSQTCISQNGDEPINQKPINRSTKKRCELVHYFLADFAKVKKISSKTPT